MLNDMTNNTVEPAMTLFNTNNAKLIKDKTQKHIFLPSHTQEHTAKLLGTHFIYLFQYQPKHQLYS